MLSLPAAVRIFVARGPTDLRRSFDSLSALVVDVLGADPLSGHLFVFFNRRRDRMKMLLWEGGGFWLLYKRLEIGTFAAVGAEEITARELFCLLEGIEVVRERVRYQKKSASWVEKSPCPTWTFLATSCMRDSVAAVVEWKRATAGVATLEEARKLIEVLGAELDSAHREIGALRDRVDRLCRQVFGRRSEKGVPEGQGLLPFVPAAAGEVAVDASDEDGGEETLDVVPVKRKKHRGRRRLPEELPRERIEVAARPEDLQCTKCSAEKRRIRSEVTEGLDYHPASFVIREYVRGVYACPCCEGEVTQPPLPARPIEKGRPEPGLLAQVVTSKYADHLPLYRQEQIFVRHGLKIGRATLAEWNGAVADLLKPIVSEAIKPELFSSPWIQTDDTTLEVRVEEREPQIRRGHMWVYRGEGGEVLYDFTWSRSRDGPLRMLAGYRGYLQADAAPAYDDVFRNRPEIVEVGCWAHARRYFKEAVGSAAAASLQILVLIRELYGIERSAAELSVERRRELRDKQARAVLAKIEARLVELGQSTLPKSPLAEAIGYTLRNWTALGRYVEDGRLQIDNNGAERAIKPVVLGRKNWLFCGSEAAAHRAAVLLSLVQTCKHLGIDPFTYLRDLIDRVSTHPMSRIAELTPREWKRLRIAASRAAA